MSIVERERVEEVVAPKVVTEADVLERAADLLEEFGWCQGEIARRVDGSPARMGEHDPEAVSFCAAGAWLRAGNDLGVPFDPSDDWDAHLEPLLRPVGVPPSPRSGTWGVQFWNDAPERTKAEVVTALRTAAKEART